MRSVIPFLFGLMIIAVGGCAWMPKEATIQKPMVVGPSPIVGERGAAGLLSRYCQVHGRLLSQEKVPITYLFPSGAVLVDPHHLGRRYMRRQGVVRARTFPNSEEELRVFLGGPAWLWPWVPEDFGNRPREGLVYRCPVCVEHKSMALKRGSRDG